MSLAVTFFRSLPKQSQSQHSLKIVPIAGLCVYSNRRKLNGVFLLSLVVGVYLHEVLGLVCQLRPIDVDGLHDYLVIVNDTVVEKPKLATPTRAATVHLNNALEAADYHTDDADTTCHNGS
jgi:hypothetical protein